MESLTEQNNKLLISFSGGETSAYMTNRLIEHFNGWRKMIIVFANTGEENEETLEFVKKCDEYFGWNVVWVEAIVNPIHGEGVEPKIVNFETAHRPKDSKTKTSPFEAMIQKYGIPNVSFKHCSRVLKGDTIRAYARSIGWNKQDYKTAIGIRSDEFDRISESASEENLYYPLVSWGITKQMVNRFWRDMPFRLNLKGYEGNCQVCWKKTLRKHLTIAKENPYKFDNFKDWEYKYENYIPESQKNSRTAPIRFFRNHLTVDKIKELSSKPFKPATDDSVNYNEYIQLSIGEEISLDSSNGCIESCEAF